VKLHEIGTGEVAIARKAMGPGIKLMVDTNCPWTTDQAIAMAKEFAPHDLLWIEEPVWPPEDYAAMARVRRDGGVAVAAGRAMRVAPQLELLPAGVKGIVDEQATGQRVTDARISHILLAMAILPMAIVTLTRGLKGRYAEHRRIARKTFPIWMYVSVTGVVVYWMLYHLYPPA
jgi:hypothetical protein